MRISDWSSDVCSSDLAGRFPAILYGAGLAGFSCGGSGKPSGHGADCPWLSKGDPARRFRFGQDSERHDPGAIAAGIGSAKRSEEHTSELQSLMRISYAVLCLKKKNKLHRQQLT